MAGECHPKVPSGLCCEYLVNPMGVHEALPRLSWRLPTGMAAQSAYQVLAASTAARLAADDADLWDSGRVSGGDSLGIEYAGRPLRTLERC